MPSPVVHSRAVLAASSSSGLYFHVPCCRYPKKTRQCPRIPIFEPSFFDVFQKFWPSKLKPWDVEVCRRNSAPPRSSFSGEVALGISGHMSLAPAAGWWRLRHAFAAPRQLQWGVMLLGLRNWTVGRGQPMVKLIGDLYVQTTGCKCGILPLLLSCFLQYQTLPRLPKVSRLPAGGQY